jgi:hypothetical protein
MEAQESSCSLSMGKTCKSRLRSGAALACFVLVLLFAAVEVLHVDTESGVPTSSPVCVLCVSAHSSVATPEIHAAPLVAMLGFVAPPQPPDTDLSFSHSSIYIRPPPSV